MPRPPVFRMMGTARVGDGEGAEVVLGKLPRQALEADQRGGGRGGGADLLEIAIDRVLAGGVAVLGAEAAEHLGPFHLRVGGEPAPDLLLASDRELRRPAGRAPFPQRGVVFPKFRGGHFPEILLVGDPPLGTGRHAGQRLDASCRQAGVARAEDHLPNGG
jgi:hypothetical protein